MTLNTKTSKRDAARIVCFVLFASTLLGAMLFLGGTHPFYAALATILPPAALAYAYAVEITFSGGENE